MEDYKKNMIGVLIVCFFVGILILILKQEENNNPNNLEHRRKNNKEYFQSFQIGDKFNPNFVKYPCKIRNKTITHTKYIIESIFFSSLYLTVQNKDSIIVAIYSKNIVKY